MSRIQSSNITSLSTELGFPPDGAEGRDPKEFKRTAAEFRVRFAQKGHPLPFSEPYSIEAEKYALEFCREDDRAAKLWPPNDHGWPCWTTDKTKILRALAHIFGLQAYYQYQKEGKARKKITSPATPTRPTAEFHRDLSPASRLYVGPSPPKGTRRRPNRDSAEGKEVSGNMAPENVTYAVGYDSNQNKRPSVGSSYGDSPEVHKACTDEIADLDPRRDEKPIKDFTTSWLAKTIVRWPAQADARLRTFMHEYNYYEADDTDHKIVELVKVLRKGTDIENCEARHFIILRQRVMERMGILAESLLSKGLIERKKGEKPQKTPVFSDYWEHRHGSWRPPHSSKKATPHPYIRPSVFDVPDEDDIDDDANVVPSSSFPSKVPRGTPKTNDTSRTSSTRKADEMNEQSPGITDRNKRQRTGTKTNPTAMRIPSPVSATITVQAGNSSADTMVEVPETESERNVDSLQVAPAASNQEPLNRQRAVQSPYGVYSPASSPPRPTSPNLTNTNKQIPAETRSAASTSARAETPTNRQRLVLILQKSARDLDLDYENTLSSSDLRKSSVAQFFEIYSQRAHVPLESLECLTFTLLFARGNETVIKQGDDAAWKMMIRKTKGIFMLQSERNPKIEEFEIVVEIGDKRTGVVPVAYDDDW